MRTGSVELRDGTAADLAEVRALLAAARLPFDDLEAGRQDFVVAATGPKLVGCVALETYGDVALLRSLAVAEYRRGAGLGRALYDQIVVRARRQGLRRLFLLTTSAAPFFLRRGFEVVDRSAVPAHLTTSAQFAGLCPSSAACLALSL